MLEYGRTADMIGSILEAMIANADMRERQLRAHALRAMRKVDRPLARFALKRWRDSDELSRVSSDMVIFGAGAYRIEHVDVASIQMPDPPKPSSSGL